MNKKKSWKKNILIILIIIGMIVFLRGAFELIIFSQSVITTEKYIEARVSNMERQVRKQGISDFRIQVEKERKRKFIKEVGEKPISLDSYNSFYSFEYYSDEIADLYATAKNDVEREALLDQMTKVYDILSASAQWNGKYHSMRIYAGDRQIDAYMRYTKVENRIEFKTSQGECYSILKTSEYERLYYNDEIFYEREIIEPESIDPIIPTQPNVKPSHKDDYYGEFHGSVSDPYDVEDYDNADDFADEWAEEFADSYNGDYEDGYDDAYDYWESGY